MALNSRDVILTRVAKQEVAIENEEKDRRFVVALSRGLDVLRCFETGDTGLGNLEIAKRTGLPKPTISRLTYTLTKLGYLLHSNQHGTYQLGPGVLQLGYATLAGLDIRERARPLMQEAANMLDATIALGARDRSDMVYLEVCHSPSPVTLGIDVGAHIPLAVTSMGRALLAALPEQSRDEVLDDVRSEAANAKELNKIEKGVAKAIKDVGTRGYSMSLGEWRSEVNAVGVPLITHDGRVLALNCGGPAFRLTQDYLESKCGPELVKLGKKIAALS